MITGIGSSSKAVLILQPFAKRSYIRVCRLTSVSCCCSATANNPDPAKKPNTSSPPLVNPLEYRRSMVCPQCKGTGKKPCGQCEGTGVNQEDKFGGSVKAGEVCWLCEGVAKTMCGGCVDLTDTF